MPELRALLIILAFSASIGLSQSVQAKADTPSVICLGEAFSLKDNALAYSEEHQEAFLGSNLLEMKTQYRDAKGLLVATRVLDFSASATQPAYHLQDLRTGYEEGASRVGRNVKVFNRLNKSSDRKEKTISVPEPFVIDGGFHPFLKANWARLEKGEKISFYFVVPSRLDYFHFVASVDANRIQTAKDKRVWVALPQSRLLKLLVEPIVTTYDAKTRRMLEYQGLSNIEDANGKSQKIRLIYKEPGL